MSRAVRRDRPAVTPIGYSAAPTHRVLVLGDGLDGVANEIEDLTARYLAEPEFGVELDLVRSPTTALRVIAGNPGTLAPYDAVAVISMPGPRRRRAGADRAQAAAPVVVDIPLLLVDLRDSEDDRPSLPQLPVGPGGTAVLTLAAATDPHTIARRIAATLRRMLEREPPPAPAPVRSDGGRGPLDALALRRLEHITRLTRDGFGTAAAEVSIIGRDQVATIVSAGASPRRHPRTDSLCGLTVTRDGSMVLLDTWRDEEARRMSPTTGEDAVRFYVGHPIGSPDGEFLGVLCIWDHAPVDSDEGLDLPLLRDLALLAEGELADALRRAR